MDTMTRWIKILFFKLVAPVFILADMIRNESAAGMPELTASDDDSQHDL